MTTSYFNIRLCVLACSPVLSPLLPFSVFKIFSAISVASLSLCSGFRSHVFKVDRQSVNAAQWRGDVVRELAGFVDGLRHDAQQILSIQR